MADNEDDERLETADDLELDDFGYFAGFVLPEHFITKRISSINSALKGTYTNERIHKVLKKKIYIHI